jgi:iron complex transport system substrate-binding protein
LWLKHGDRWIKFIYRRTDLKKGIIILLHLLLLSALLAAAACSSETASTPTPTSAQTNYPLSVVDMLGRSVQISQRPTRIVTTHPTATEMLYCIGGSAVGRDSSSKYPPEAQVLPTVGSAYNINVESIAALKPDLILIEVLTQAGVVGSLEKLGVPIVAVRASSLEDISQGLTLVGKITDMNEAAVQAIAQIQGRIETAQSNSSGGKNILILISDAQRNVYAAKPESYPGAVAALLKLGNTATGLPESGPYPGFALFTAEQALNSNPDVVFTISPAPPPAPRLSEMLPQIPGFNQMTAVKGGQVVELDPFLFLQAQGPRIADAAEEMLRLINEAAE